MSRRKKIEIMVKGITMPMPTSGPLNPPTSAMVLGSSTEIISSPEKWNLNITCLEDDLLRDRELTQFTLNLPNGRTFSGTIQDIQSIEVFARNARKELLEYASNGFTDKTDEMEVLDTIKEVNVLLSMFK